MQKCISFIKGESYMSGQKKVLLFMTVFCVIIALFVIFFISRVSKDEETNSESDVFIDAYETQAPEKAVFYSEGGEDLSYCYITNIGYVANQCPETPYMFFQCAGKEINNFLQGLGYENETLTVTDANISGTYLYVTAKMDSGNGTLHIEYEYGKSEWNMYISQ